MNLVFLAELFEIFMVCLFGFSWPMNVVKSLKTKSAKGKSLPFLLFIFVGYIFGIASKFINPSFDFGSKWYVLMFYIINFLMVGIDIVLYFRNKHLDKLRESGIGTL